jgi:hypothetical protein
MKDVGGMTHEEIVKFLLRGTGHKYTPTTRKYFDSTLYGTKARVGVLEGFCWRKKDGSWKVKGRTKLEGPFNPRRAESTSRYPSDLLVF